jgi:hypothetical protein
MDDAHGRLSDRGHCAQDYIPGQAQDHDRPCRTRLGSSGAAARLHRWQPRSSTDRQRHSSGGRWPGSLTAGSSLTTTRSTRARPLLGGVARAYVREEVGLRKAEEVAATAVASTRPLGRMTTCLHWRPLTGSVHACHGSCARSRAGTAQSWLIGRASTRAEAVTPDSKPPKARITLPGPRSALSEPRPTGRSASTGCQVLVFGSNTSLDWSGTTEP